MTKKDYIGFWIETAERDWNSSEDLFRTKHYLQSLFFAHLCLEKLCKAIWVYQHAENHPPRIHNLIYLLKQTHINLTNEQLDFLLVFNDFQIEGRYPDYQQQVYKHCTEPVTQEWLNNAKDFKTWLLSNLPLK